jgi:hypothetical protein
MAVQYVCPHCGSKKISKQEGDDEYCCDDCLEFFKEPKIVGEKVLNKKRSEQMGNRYKSDLDREKIRVLAVDKTVPEISEATGYKINSIRSALLAMGIKAKNAYTHKPRKSSNIEKQTIKKQNCSHQKPLSDITALDMLIAERNMHQDKVFQLNKAIEILS